MKPGKSPILLALLAALIFTAVGVSQELGPPVPRKHLIAERSITVVFDPGVSPISAAMLDEIVQSKDFATAAISELIGREARLTRRPYRGNIRGSVITETKGWVDTSHTEYFITFWPRQPLVGSQADDRLHLTLQVDIFGEAEEREAEQYADLVIKHLGNILADLSRREFELRVQQLEKIAQDTKARFELAQRRVDETRHKLRQLTTPFSESILQELVTSLKKQQQALEVELAGMKGRAEALQRAIAKAAEQTKKEPADDDVVKQLERVLELRREQLLRLRDLHKQGTVPATEVAKAEEQGVLAQVELAQAKRAAMRPAGEQLDKLNGELSHIAVNRAEIEAKLDYVEDQLAVHEELLKREADAKPLRQQLEKQIAARAILRSPDQAVAEVETLKASFRPARVEIFELNPGDNKREDDTKSER